MEFQHLREKWIQFFDVKSDVRTMVQVYYTPGLYGRPLPLPDNEDQRVDWALRRYESMCEAKKVIDDDVIPFLSPYTGTEIFAAAFGCKVHYPVDNMPFALPRIHSAEEVRAIRRPSHMAPPLERTFRIARRLKEAYPDALIQLPDIQSPFDIAALIWEKGDFYPACIDEPEAVEDLCHMVEEVLVKFLDAWFAEFGTDYIAHFPDYFMRGGMTLSEDEAGSVSPAVFERMCLPALIRLSKRYGGLSFHSCANSEHQWENFKKIPDLRLVNLNQPEAVIDRARFVFRDVAAQLHHSGFPLAKEGWKRYGPEDAHVVLYAPASTEDDAKRMLDIMKAQV